MGRPKKIEPTDQNEINNVVEDTNPTVPCSNDLEWTDYVLSLLSDDEKIAGNPTTDGLRRIFEIALSCTVISAESTVIQCPSPDNEKRATVSHRLTYVLNDDSVSPLIKERVVSGAADVYWGNCDKVYRNHPVAVAETRAEGRALRRALKLRKVVAAEELAKDIEDHPDHDTVTKITNNQLNFIDVLGKRLNINISKLLEKLDIENNNVYNIGYSDAVNLIKTLNEYQQQNNISEDILNYESNWK
jgi:hypothetical protein